MPQNVLHILSWEDEDEELHTETLSPTQETVTLGRSWNNDIFIGDSSVSRNHAELSWQGPFLVICDKNSSFGTWIDSVKLMPDEYRVIKSDCEIRLGSLKIWYKLRKKGYEHHMMQTRIAPETVTDKKVLFCEIESYKNKSLEHLKNNIGKGVSLAQLISGIDKDLSGLINKNLSEINVQQNNRLKEQYILHAISHLLNQSQTLNDFANSSLDLAAKVLNVERAFILLYNLSAKKFNQVAFRYFNKNEKSNSNELTYKKDLVDQCFQQNKLLIFNKSSDNPSPSNVKLSEAASAVVIPLQRDNEVIGVLYFDHLTEMNCVDSQQFMFLQNLATHIVIAQQNAQIYKQAITDRETQFYSRQYIIKLLHQEIRTAKLDQRIFSLLLLKLSNFQQLDSAPSEQTNIQLVKSFSLLLKDLIRKTGVVGRIDKDKFLVILKDISFNEAKDLTKRIKLKATNHFLGIQDQSRSTKVSIGIIDYQAKYQDNYQLLMEDIEKALMIDEKQAVFSDKYLS